MMRRALILLAAADAAAKFALEKKGQKVLNVKLSAPTPPEPYIEEGDDSVHVTLYSIAVLSLCALLVGVIAAAATHVAMKQKSVQMLERSKAPWQSYGSRDEEGAPLIAKRPSLSFSV